MAEENRDSQKNQLVMQVKVSIADGLNLSNSARLSILCQGYKDNFAGARTVLAANRSKSKEGYLEATSILNLMALDARQGNELEVKVEGVDDAAKSFAYEFRKALTQEGYLGDKISRMRDQMTSASADPHDLRPLYKRDYKEPPKIRH